MENAPYPTKTFDSLPPDKDSSFFLRLTGFITVTIFSGFILNWALNPENLGRITLWTGLHGAFSASWYLLLLSQIRFSSLKNYRSHAFWGKLSIVLVIAILLSGTIMTLEFYERLAGFGVFSPDDAQARVRAGSFIGGVFLQWAIFISLYLLAILNIGNPAYHKRFMIAAAIQMMPEGLNRLVHILALPGYSMFILMFCIYAFIMLYDWKIYKRVHTATICSIGLFIVLATSMNTIFLWQAWGDWVTKVLSGI